MSAWDERDFIDDMLDDMSTVGLTAGGATDTSGISGSSVVYDASGSKLGTLSGGGFQVNPALGKSAAQVVSENPALQANLGVGAYTADIVARQAGGVGPGNVGPAYSTPGASLTPGIETPGLDLSPIVGALDPRLRRILGSIRAMQLQSQATSEHNTLSKQAAFRTMVQTKLATIERRLPASSSLAQQIRTVRVLIG